jgi:hypothetical protein
MKKLFSLKKLKRNHIVLGGLALAGVALLLHTQKCGILKQFFESSCTDDSSMYDMGPSIFDPDPFVELDNDGMSTRPITDDYVQQYNRFINGYRESPTMFPENYYDLPFRYEGPDKGILTSPGIPDSFGSNPINPNPNAPGLWIRQPFFF